ncbi:hypothetical protein ACJIZ3_006163 [Penstemon smallii]|uniref:Aminotransferase-like plant mobile domain-containing protein n=1 Tax=Penstemon smallii TaxID=265156 RepID=A0ABD3S7D0_9LAMI
MKFIRYNIHLNRELPMMPYPTLYVINKGETDNTRGTALAVYPPAIGPFASEYAVSKEKHPSKFSAEITKDASVDATALSKRQKMCLLQSGTPKEGSPPKIHTSLAHDRTKEEDAPFDALGVKEPDREETYVAALLACWICRFLLPSRNINHIRPGVFKVASMIASGEKFSLAIPVLASIYRGLKQLTSSTDLKECTAVFPIHYVYGWISSYLKTHFEREDTEIFAGERMARKYNLAEAQHIFESIEPSQMMPLPMFREKKLQMLCDSGTSSDMEKDYFLCLRSCYLVLRLDKHYIVEFYDPHRFGRQFGFSQDLPSGIRAEQNPKTFEAAMLALPRSSERLVTKEYLQWWSSHYRSPFKDAPKVTVKLSNGAHDSSKKVQVESKKKVIDPSNDGARNESAIDDVSKTLDVQTAKVKRTMVESSTSESDSNCDRNWKRCKKSQVFDLDSISIDSKTFFGDSLIPNMDLEDLIQYFEILDAPLNQEASSKGKGIEVPVDRTHSSLSQHKEICDDSDRIPLTQVLAQSKKKATGSKIPLHIPSFDNLGVQRTDPSSSKNKEVKTNFEPPARKSPSSVSGFRCKEVVERSQRKVAEIMWSDLVQQFSTTPLEWLLSIKEEVDGILQAMNQLGGMDVSFLHERVAAFLEIAGGYANEISSSSQRMDKELFDRQISDASQHHEAKLTKLVEDEDNLKKRLEDILSQKQKMKNEISVLKSSPPLSEEDFMRQRNLKEKFEADLQELKDFKLFP